MPSATVATNAEIPLRSGPPGAPTPAEPVLGPVCGAPRSYASPLVPQWEYRLVCLRAEGDQWLLGELAEAGEDGWEAVGFVPVVGPALQVLVKRLRSGGGAPPAPVRATPPWPPGGRQATVGRPIPPPPMRSPPPGD
jgi:hypothetical protein